MRGSLDLARRENAPNGVGARPTVGLAQPMRNDTQQADKDIGPRPSGIAFDSKQRLRGVYDDVRLGVAR